MPTTAKRKTERKDMTTNKKASDDEEEEGPQEPQNIKHPVAPEQPVSTDKSVRKSKYVSHEEFAQFRAEIVQEINGALKQQFDNTEQMVSGKINASNAEISKALNEHGNAIQSIAAAIQNGTMQVQPQAPTSRQQRFDDFMGQINQILENPLVKQKLGLEQDPISSEFSNLAEVVATGAKREVAAAMKTSIRKYLKQGHLYPAEVDGIIDTAASAASKVTQHGI